MNVDSLRGWLLGGITKGRRMGTCTWNWQPVAPAILVAGLIAAPVGLDLQQGFWVAGPEAYARGSDQDGPGGGVGEARSDGSGGRGGAGEGATSAARADGPGGRGDAGGGGGAAGVARGDGLGGRGGAGEGAASAARGDGLGGRGGEQTLATARDRYNRALGATAQVTAKAKAGFGKQFDTAKAVFVFSEEEAEALIQAGWVAPLAKAARAFANHGQKVATP
jgi:hypothetical protein